MKRNGSMPRYGADGSGKAEVSLSIARHVTSFYLAIEFGYKLPEVVCEKADIAELRIPHPRNERIGPGIDRIRTRESIFSMTQRLEKQTQIVVEQAVADEERRPF